VGIYPVLHPRRHPGGYKTMKDWIKTG